MIRLFHSQQEKELLQYETYLGKADSRLSMLESTCVLVASMAALVLMVTAYYDMVKV